MLSGIKEIVLVVMVLVALFMIPRFIRSGKAPEASSKSSGSGDRNQAGMLRLAVLLSVLWIALAMVLLNPIKGELLPFMGAGVLPVGLAWGIRWVVLGFKK